MDADILFVKEQIGVQERLASKYAAQPHRAGLHLNTADRLRSLLRRIDGLLSKETNGGPNTSNKVNVSLTDLDDLPAELRAELSISETDLQEMIIEDLIIKNSGVISLDKLIVRFYQRQKEVLRRNTLTSRLFRMAEKGMIFNVPGKRGYYSSFEMAEDDVARVFGKPENYVHESSTEGVEENQKSVDSEVAEPTPILRRRVRTTRFL